MIIGAIVLLCVCPFMAKDRLQLPWLFRWFDIVDSYIGRDTSVIKSIYAAGWWSRYCYCAWRNPINYFDYQYLGLHWNGAEVYTRYNPAEDNIGDGSRAGLRNIEVLQANHNYYEYYWIYRYPMMPSVCFRFRLGWKITNKQNPAGTVSQWVYVVSPFHGFTGK